MIILPKEVAGEIYAHVQESYPCEGCGILVGALADPKKVVKSYRAVNLNQERAQDRYLMDPADIARAEREAADMGLAVIGFYHSHPDHPADPSQFDLRQAKQITDAGWPPIYSYLIIAVHNGRLEDINSWVLNVSQGEFEHEDIKTD